MRKGETHEKEMYVFDNDAHITLFYEKERLINNQINLLIGGLTESCPDPILIDIDVAIKDLEKLIQELKKIQKIRNRDDF